MVTVADAIFICPITAQYRTSQYTESEIRLLQKLVLFFLWVPLLFVLHFGLPKQGSKCRFLLPTQTSTESRFGVTFWFVEYSLFGIRSSKSLYTVKCSFWSSAVCLYVKIVHDHHCFLTFRGYLHFFFSREKFELKGNMQSITYIQ